MHTPLTTASAGTPGATAGIIWASSSWGHIQKRKFSLWWLHWDWPCCWKQSAGCHHCRCWAYNCKRRQGSAPCHWGRQRFLHCTLAIERSILIMSTRGGSINCEGHWHRRIFRALNVILWTLWPILGWGCFTVLGDSYWSRGLVLRVPSREKILKRSICFKLTNECWKTFSENYGESWHFAFTSFVYKRQNVT